ncbi:MAG TPA: (Fe-S)-binding protein, partial [Actinobacteria bacterium]|nr:(Fe-S)-binding protein [Actinomycetota bacterium]
TRCGNCLDLCSAYLGSGDVSISPKKKMEKLKSAVSKEYGLIARLLKKKVTKEEMEAISHAAFACTMCSRCEVDCHINIKLQDIWLKLREIMVDEGQYPEVLDMMRNRLKESRNVSFDTNEGRTDWIKPVPDIPEDRFIRKSARIIYFVGCVSSFSPRTFKIPRSIVQIFQKADIDFALLGDEEWCCGFPLMSSGFAKDFIEFAEHNIEKVNRTGAKYLVTSCPSCYHMWSHVYPEKIKNKKMNFEVLHAVQYLYMLVEEGRIKLNSIDKKITYHDPCDLGRNSGIYDEPRKLIRSIPGVEFIELENSREYATCCGGGGNVESTDAGLSANIAAIKAREIIKTGADIVVTSCQQCVRTITTALKKEKSKIKAMDLIQLVLESTGEDS